MSEETKLVKTRPLTEDEIKKILVEHQGKAILVNNFLDNTSWVLKITQEPILREFPKEDEFDEDTGKPVIKQIPYFHVEYKFMDRHIPLILRTSVACYESFMKNNNGKDYIGKYAVFSCGKRDNKRFHSVGVIYKDGFEPTKFIDPLAMMEDIETKAEEAAHEDNTSRAKQFFGEFMKTVSELNTMKDKEGKPEEKIKPSIELVCAKYMRKFYRAEFDAISGSF